MSGGGWLLSWWAMGACATVELGDSAPATPEACDAPTSAATETFTVADLVDDPAAVRAPLGLTAGDLDGDGLVDVWLATTGGSVFFHGDGAGGLTPSAAVTVDGGPLPAGTGVAAADHDRDGDLDLALATWSGFQDRLLVNDGKGRFTSVELDGPAGFSTHPVWGDFTGDGKLDLFMARGATPDFTIEEMLTDPVPGDPSSLFVQDPTTCTFSERADALPQSDIDGAHSLAATAVDADSDGDLDVYLANDFGPYMVPSVLLRNDGSGRFERATDCRCETATFGMGVGVGDVNDDHEPDLYVTDVGGPDLFASAGAGTWYDATLAAGAEIPPTPEHVTSWGARFVDIDLDGADDIAVAFGRLDGDNIDSIGLLVPDIEEDVYQIDVLLRDEGDGYSDISEEVGFAVPDRHRALITTDLDGDLRPEVIVAGKATMVVRSFGGGCAGGIAVTAPPELAALAFGARVEVTVDGVRRTRWNVPAATGSASEPIVFAGLGHADTADVTLTWTDGTQDTWTGVPAGTLLVATPGG